MFLVLVVNLFKILVKLIEVHAKLHEFEEFEKTFEKDEILEI
jgi:hypothetical protein